MPESVHPLEWGSVRRYGAVSSIFPIKCPSSAESNCNTFGLFWRCENSVHPPFKTAMNMPPGSSTCNVVCFLFFTEDDGSIGSELPFSVAQPISASRRNPARVQQTSKHHYQVREGTKKTKLSTTSRTHPLTIRGFCCRFGINATRVHQRSIRVPKHP